MGKIIGRVSLLLVAMAVVGSSVMWARAEDAPSAVAKSVKYSDDFKDQTKVDADSEVVQNAKVFPTGLSSADSNPGYVIWDLDKVLADRAPGAKVTLFYSGGANGPAELRGVTWAVSADAKDFKDISINEFDKPIEFEGRFLKATVRWQQAGGPDYGFVRSFSIKAAAK